MLNQAALKMLFTNFTKIKEDKQYAYYIRRSKRWQS